MPRDELIPPPALPLYPIPQRPIIIQPAPRPPPLVPYPSSYAPSPGLFPVPVPVPVHLQQPSFSQARYSPQPQIERNHSSRSGSRGAILPEAGTPRTSIERKGGGIPLTNGPETFIDSLHTLIGPSPPTTIDIIFIKKSIARAQSPDQRVLHTTKFIERRN
ncbi:hypothetical protein B9479_001282 [Cryptococcus floricola]|uniref:Uncharacterized protein n=1 Tax=Cryptococcus floricola TaxID=2591691 RepID=A0A5D3B2J3_9TREE|nr:hypothetical protein B9479_001282 [Cryptococcus floricola]